MLTLTENSHKLDPNSKLERGEVKGVLEGCSQSLGNVLERDHEDSSIHVVRASWITCFILRIGISLR
jgi:hypothetical protein